MALRTALFAFFLFLIGAHATAQSARNPCPEPADGRRNLHSLTAALRTAAAPASRNAGALVTEDLNARARERIRLLECLTPIDPEFVVQHLLSPEERSAHSTAGLTVESIEEVEAPVNVIVRDDLERHAAVFEVRPVGESYAIHAGERQAGVLQCGDIVRMGVARVGKARVLVRATVVSQAEVAGCSPVGEQKVAVILLKKPGSPQPGTDAAYWHQRLFHPTDLTLAAFVSSSSHGAASVTGEVFGWFEAARDYACSDLMELRSLALEAAAPHLRFEDFNRVVILLETGLSESCGGGAFGQVGCIHQSTPQGFHTFSVSWLFARHIAEASPLSPDTSTVIHEFGHNLGLHHARALSFEGEVLGVNRSSGAVQEYGDQYSMMGGVGDFSARHKAQIQWLDPASSVLTVDAAGDYVIAPLQAESARPRALRVRRGAGSQEWIWLETRQHSPWERPAGAPAFEDVSLGAFLHYENSQDIASTRYTDRLTTDLAPENPRLLRPKLKPGQSWRDGHSPLHLQVIGQNAGETQVRVTYEPLCAVLTQPGGPISPAGGVYSVSVNAPAGCAWNAVSSAEFAALIGPAERSGGGVVEFQFAPNHGPDERTASLTVGRQVITVIQAGMPQAPLVTSVDLLTLGVQFSQPAGFQVSVRDGNGVQNIQEIEIRIGPSRARPICVASVHFPSRIVKVYGFDNTTPADSFPLNDPREVLGSFCKFGLLGWQEREYLLNAPELSMSFQFTPLPIAATVDSIATAFYVRVKDQDGNQAPWRRFQQFSIAEQCIVATPGSRLVLDDAARSAQWHVSAPEGCLWAAETDSAVLQFDREWKVGSRTLSLTVPAHNGETRSHMLEVGTRDKQVVRVPAVPAAPVIPGANSIVHGARFLPPVAGGSWFSVFGEHLALASHGWQGEDFHQYLLPPGLDGVEVLVNGEPVPVAFVSPGQVNALMPAEHGEGLVRLKVRTPFGESAEHLVPVALFAQGLFYSGQNGKKLAAAHHADGARVGPFETVEGVVVARPAQPGDVISIYGTGFGPTNPPVDDRILFQGAAPLTPQLTASVRVGGLNAPVEFIGKSAAGLYQVNVRVPALPEGDHSVVLQIAHLSSSDEIVIPVAP